MIAVIRESHVIEKSLRVILSNFLSLVEMKGPPLPHVEVTVVCEWLSIWGCLVRRFESQTQQLYVLVVIATSSVALELSYFSNDSVRLVNSKETGACVSC